MDALTFSFSWIMADYSNSDYYNGPPWGFGYSEDYQQTMTLSFDDVPASDGNDIMFVSPAEHPESYEDQPPPSPLPPKPKRMAGNNPYGSKGCASCIRCRKRKGKVLRFHASLTLV